MLCSSQYLIACTIAVRDGYPGLPALRPPPLIPLRSNAGHGGVLPFRTDFLQVAAQSLEFIAVRLRSSAYTIPVLLSIQHLSASSQRLLFTTMQAEIGLFDFALATSKDRVQAKSVLVSHCLSF